MARNTAMDAPASLIGGSCGKQPDRGPGCCSDSMAGASGSAVAAMGASGALTAGSATVAGPGVTAWVASGALAAASATEVGSGISVSTGSGALVDVASSIAAI